MTKATNKNSHGQAIIFVLMCVVILVFALLWNIDIHRLVIGKNTTQDAGDSAALAAAKWQGETLNLIGELNILHALALANEDPIAENAITNIQARLAFTGPLTALLASQVAAKNNSIYNCNDFTHLLKEHAKEIRTYGQIIGNKQLFPEPYENAWNEYSTLLETITQDGIAAAPDNALFYGDYTTGHILLDKAFYDAIAGQIWCWFYLNTALSLEPPRTLLDEFTSYETFGPLPPPNPPKYENCEIYGLGVKPKIVNLEHHATIFDSLQSLAETHDIPLPQNWNTHLSPSRTWYFYDDTWSTPWQPMDNSTLPLAGKIKPEYNYQGADAVTRTLTTTYRLSENNLQDTLNWVSAARPFGYLTDGNIKATPETFGLILPSFHDIRLIPLDSATSGGLGTFDIPWRQHTDEHLPLYTTTGALTPSCKYCRLLETFSNPAFRAQGITWLRKNHHLCTLPPPSGTHPGGGTRHGH